MNILYVSFFYPPYQCIGAVRSGKLSKWLLRRGADVRVISAAPQPLPDSLPLEVPKERVYYSSWRDWDAFARRIIACHDARSSADSATDAGPSKVEAWYRALWHWPDGQMGWRHKALQEGVRWLGNWRPDVIYASAWPITSLLVGRAFAKAFGVPWFAEFRDLWVGNHYLDFLPHWRKRIDAMWEKHVLSDVAGVVTVSEPLAKRLRRYRKPVIVLPNGWDPEDMSARETNPPESRNELRIVYTGLLYGGRQDVTPLLKAMREMPEVRADFYGRQFDCVQRMCARFHLLDRVRFYASVPRSEALRMQRQADVLLLALWNDSREKGVYTGKLFEYLAAGRPILAIGPKDNVAADLIRRLRAGIVVSNVEEVQHALESWLSQKHRGATLSGAAMEDILPWSHPELAKRLLGFFKEIIEG